MYSHLKIVATLGIALAVTLGPARSQSKPTPTPIDKKYSILGLTSGMTPSEVESTLKKVHPDGKFERTETSKLPNESAFITSMTFVAVEQSADAQPVERSTDTVIVRFTTPLGGNISVSIVRQVSYDSHFAPVASSLSNELTDKYGKAPISFDDVTKGPLTGIYPFNNSGTIQNQNSDSPSGAVLGWQIWTGAAKQGSEYLVQSLNFEFKDRGLEHAASDLDRAAALRAQEVETDNARKKPSGTPF